MLDSLRTASASSSALAFGQETCWENWSKIALRGLRKHWQVNVQPAKTSRNGPDDPTLSHTSSGLRDLSAITRGISRLELEQDSSGRLAASCHARSCVRRVQSLKDHAEGTETCKIIERNVLCHCMTTCVKEIPTPTTFSRQRHLKPAPSPNPPPTSAQFASKEEGAHAVISGPGSLQRVSFKCSSSSGSGLRHDRSR